MKANYLFRLVLDNGARTMLASSAKTRTEAWKQARNLKTTLGATDVEVWGVDNLTLTMEIKTK